MAEHDIDIIVTGVPLVMLSEEITSLQNRLEALQSQNAALLAACEAIYAWTARDIVMRRMSWFPELKAAIAQAKESP